MRDHTQRPATPAVPYAEAFVIDEITVQTQTRSLSPRSGDGQPVHLLFAQAEALGKRWSLRSEITGRYGRFMLSAAARQLAEQLRAQIAAEA